MIIVFWVYIFLTRADIAIVTGSARHEDKSRRTKHTFEPSPKKPKHPKVKSRQPNTNRALQTTSPDIRITSVEPNLRSMFEQ